MLFEIIRFITLLFSIGMMLKGAIVNDWFFCALGILIFIAFFLLFRHYQGDIRGYVAVYPNKIIEKKKHTIEVFLNDVIEVRHFKKAIGTRQTWYMDCLQFFVKEQEIPILINPSFKGTVVPHNMTEETKAILNFLRANFPSIKFTKEEWKGPY